MTPKMNRREVMALGITSVASMSLSDRAEGAVAPLVVQAHDERLEQLLDNQITDPKNKWCGAIPDGHGLYHCRTAGRLLREGAAALFYPQSKFHKRSNLYERMQLAVGFLLRSQNAQGNIDLISTNFNSPPDTGFVVHDVATAAKLAQTNADKDLLSRIEVFLRRAGQGMAKGGIHTPNHRWVVCAALAQIHELLPDSRYVARIDQWLAEGIDIDEEGQFTERSTASYNAVVDNALVVMAHKLNRPGLLDPVRKNLDAMAYLLHPNGEVVTEISRRQDLNTKRTMSGYWFALRYMAIRDQSGLYASMLKPLEPKLVHLAALMEYPELQESLPTSTPLPENFDRPYPLAGITRIRRGKISATIMHKGNSRWVSVRRGEAVINAVRFASAFFGKGQFVPKSFQKREDGFHFRQELEGQYYQPLADSSLLPVRRERWSWLRRKRRRTEICHMVYEARIAETKQGFEMSIGARGTDNVPLAVEINFRQGGEFAGVVPVPNVAEAFLLRDGFAKYCMGSDAIRFGPGQCQHVYTQVRGSHAKLPGPSVYLTGYTPFEHTLTFQML